MSLTRAPTGEGAGHEHPAIARERTRDHRPEAAEGLIRLVS
ncbi:MAG: hypothetical protein ACOC00_06135 [Halothiobacillaceae bacterium]